MPLNDAIRTLVLGDCPWLPELERCEELDLVSISDLDSVPAGQLSAISPRIVVYAHDGPLATMREHMARITDEVDVPTLLVVEAVTSELIECASRVGARDIVLDPPGVDHIVLAVRKALALHAPAVQQQRRAARATVVTVTAAKGGVGRTFVASNVAAKIAGVPGHKVLLIDMDATSGDVSLVLGETPNYTIVDLFMSRGELDADTISRYVHTRSEGFDVLAAPRRLEDAQMVETSRLLDLLDVASMMYDTVVIDTPVGMPQNVLAALDRSDLAVVVATPDVAAIKAGCLVLESLRTMEYPMANCRVVLNRSDASVRLEQGSVRGALGHEIRHRIPSSRAVPISMNVGIPIVESDPDSEASRAIEGICAAICPEEFARTSGRRRRLLGRSRRSEAAAAAG